MTDARIERLITVGNVGAGSPGFPPEGLTLDNNVWLVGNDDQVIVVDAGHDAAAIEKAVAEREVLGILLTHGHEDHINAARTAAAALDTHIYLHPADLFLWELTHGDAMPDFELADRAVFGVAGTEVVTLHTPGHTPGSVCFALPGLGTVLTGDTLFQGGPGATRWDYSSFPDILSSIDGQLFTLPESTRVLPGHGDETSIAREFPEMEAWRSRGW
ncbi:glyoxylase-like metal-dependent hydrolase (beta-lactamase superfamily II) [Leucobacter exalbidus]|uniref:Glyoxylase-like metal-dependent hydrolase (Beta-lactamase superfamily II) n=1 Tax=Leucobacter exalbidus TaxID=662960 RepID=A0A940T301_9MICO|nr:MBL fold metallo-hydrolase [Leucobacter exalbidus]MBP1325169.1 glyoxylase-like metal-dependent hydrolase (beta-lactamase superfamily II) [Leucobacter exalbidus]